MSHIYLYYTASSGNRYTLNMANKICRVRSANFHAWEWQPDAVAKQYGVALRQFTRDPAIYETELLFSGPIDDRKTRIETLHDEWEQDIVNMTPGRLAWGSYYLDCYITSSSTYPDRQGWGTVNTITIYAPDPFWKRDWRYPVKTIPTTGYPLAIGLLWQSDFEMIINGPCVNPTILIKNQSRETVRTYAIPATLADGETVTINTRDHTVIYSDANGGQHDLYDDCDPALIFEKLPAERGFLFRQSDDDAAYTINLTIYEQRSEPREV